MHTGTARSPLSLGDGLRYGMLGLPLAFCALPLYVLMPNLYASQWGVPLSELGALLLGVRLLDAVVDPLLGMFVGRLFAASLQAVLRMGAVAAVALGLGFCFLFAPQLSAPSDLLWWAGGFLVLTYVAFSALTVAHQSWGAMLGGDAVYRSQVVAWREGLGLAGVLLATVTPVLFGVPPMLLLLLVGLALGWRMWCLAPKPEPGPETGKSRSRHAENHAWRALLHPWRSKGFRGLLGVYLLNGIASAIPATLVLFFVQDRLQAGVVAQSAALAIYFVCGALSMPLWLRLVRALGLVGTWRLGMFLSIAVFLGASQLGAGDVATFMLVCALSGAALGSDLAVPGALLAGVIQTAQGDAADAAEAAHASYFGWWNFATKINLALAAGLALPLLAWLGYTPGSRDADALGLLSFTYCVLPCMLKALAAAALQLFVHQPALTPQLP